MSQMDTNSQKHLDEITLLLYAERQLDRETAQEVSLHTQTCSRCLNLLRVLDRESRLLTRAMFEQDEPLPARLAEFHAVARRSMRWIWGLVFGVAVLGIYALYSSYVEPLEHQFEQAGFGSSSLLSLMIFQGAFWKGWQSMFTLFEGVALAVLMGVAIFAFRRYLRRGSAFAMMFASLALFGVMVSPAGASEFRKGDSVTVAKDETIHTDVFMTGNHLRVEGTVDGDVYAFGQQLDISGHVTGDVICFVQSTRVPGTVDGNIRAFVNNLTIGGTVGHSVTTFNEVFNLDSTGSIGRNLTAFVQNLSIDGKIDHDVTVFATQTVIAGFIGGNVNIKGNSLTVTSSAQIDGKTHYESNNQANVASGAKLAEPLEFKRVEHAAHERTAGYYIWRVIQTGAFILLGLVLISLLPKFSSEVTDAAENVGASFGLGVLVVPGVLIAGILACVTIVGLWVGLIGILLWLIAMFCAEVVVGAIVGRWVMGRTRETWPMIARMAVGVILVRIVTTLPWIGPWAMVAVVLWGMGAIALGVYRRLQPVVAPNIPSVPMGPIGTPLPPHTTVSPI